MLSSLSIVLPIFALIFAGWFTRTLGILGPNATSELNRFVVYLALPALLFDIIAHARPADVWQPGFILAFTLGTLLVFVITVVLQMQRSRHLADAALDALNASYANTGFMGFPLALAFLGQDALAPTLIATIITICVLFAIAIVIIEVGVQSEQRGVRLVMKVTGSLVRNPLLVAPIVAMFFPLTGLSVPSPVTVFLKLLGGAASPCALIVLGLFLANKPSKAPYQPNVIIGLLVILKLLLHPLIVWVMATWVFALPSMLVHTAVLLAALPTGTGPFMLAEFYQREGRITSRCVLFSTLVSIVTITLYLYWIRR
ncbi:transporter [Candidatus Symbiopectobacterium sp. 'North America']|uniref:AEC family transporter n=1 Tax=Candidatus Symbiopectobacterium sp. 'North America' TaxID=2794574 RepID=UPI0018CB17F1|nr:AEC family transporter [Candidatus Symbiopectobacterium sp. 'North America']MBG6244562.1 transporter [Candidatus Symbiopectobacterium sp. 'North America']